MRYFLLLIMRSLLAVAVGITGVAIFIALINSGSSLLVIPLTLFWGLFLFGIPSIIGIAPLLWMQDRGAFGANKLFTLLGSCAYGFVVGFIAASVSFPLLWHQATFEWGLSLLGALGGAVGGLYSGIRCVTKRDPNQGVSSRVTWSE